MDQVTLLAGVAALLFLGAGYVLFGTSPSSADKRVGALTKVGGKKRSGLFKFLKVEESGARRKQIEQSLADMEQDQKNKKKKRKTLKAKLVQANWGNVNTQLFTLVSCAIGLIIGLAILAFTKQLLAALAIAFILGFGLPRYILNVVIKRRQKKFVGGFADAMDIIVRGVRTGLPLGDCLKIIAHESPVPISSEFMLVVEGETVGVPLETCLERMYERMPVPEVSFFSTVLNIQRSTGGNLGEALDNLSKVLRGRKILREKIKALSAEAKVSAIIIGALPLVVMLLVSLVSPDYMTELYTTKRGHKNLMIGAGMMVMGSLIMRKMINFKI